LAVTHSQSQPSRYEVWVADRRLGGVGHRQKGRGGRIGRAKMDATWIRDQRRKAGRTVKLRKASATGKRCPPRWRACSAWTPRRACARAWPCGRPSTAVSAPGSAAPAGAGSRHNAGCAGRPYKTSEYVVSQRVQTCALKILAACAAASELLAFSQSGASFASGPERGRRGARRRALQRGPGAGDARLWCRVPAACRRQPEPGLRQPRLRAARRAQSRQHKRQNPEFCRVNNKYRNRRKGHYGFISLPVHLS